MCYIVRLNVKGKGRFSLRRMDMSTTGIGSKYFNCIGEAKKHAEKLGLKIIGYKG